MLRGKLGSIRRQVDRRSKFLKVINEGENENNDFINWKISKEKHGIDVKREMYTSTFRKAIVRWRMLQKCLSENREDSDLSKDNLYGHYGGRPINAYNHQIDYYIEDSAPAKQKKRKIRYQMKEGRKKGKILDTDAVLEKITDYFQESWGVKYKPSVHGGDTADDRLEMARKYGNRNEKFEDRFRPKRMSLKAPGKLPPVPGLKKSLTTPISLPTRNIKHGESRVAFGAQPETDGQSNRKQTMDRLLRKVECTRPSCEGYVARSVNVRKVLPPILRITRSNSDSTLDWSKGHGRSINVLLPVVVCDDII